MFGPKEIQRILDTTDALGLSREWVIIPLHNTGEGEVRIVGDGRLRITAPQDDRIDDWIRELPGALRALDLSRIPRNRC